MKAILVGLLFFGAVASADTYVCDVADLNQTLLLKKIKDVPLNGQPDLDMKAEYEMQLQTTELPFPSVKVKGYASSYDVQFDFVSDDGKYKVMMFMDDAAGTLTIGKKEHEFSNCRFF